MDISTVSAPMAGVARHMNLHPAHAVRSATTVLPAAGSVQELLRLLGSTEPCGNDAVIGLHMPVLRVQPDAVMLHEGSRAHTLYVVRSGSFKCTRTLEDGYEQVLSFALPGELIGFEALHAGTRQSSAIALEDSTVYSVPNAVVQDLQQRCPLLGDALRQALSRQLTRAVETAEMMSAVASDARLARFVLWMSARMAETGQSANRLRLRMPRRDIASLLGLAHETVSRSFTQLVEHGCLRVDNRELEILDLQALRLRARTTRGPQSECSPRKAVRPNSERAAPPNGWWQGRNPEPLAA
jgi:CRP/FNR family transcriptional regulator